MESIRYYMMKAMLPINKGEMDIETYTGVTFAFQKHQIHNLNLKLTTHRILLWQPQFNQYCLVLNMSEMTSVDGKEQGFLKKQAFIEISTIFNDKVRLYIKQVDIALLQIRGTFNKAAWKQVAQPPPEAQKTLFAGIHEEHKKIKSDLQTKQTQMQQSFSSFDTLYMSIKELKQVTTYVRDNLKLYDESLQQKSEIENILNDIGFVSSITKQEAGKNYYKEEAKRIFQICNTTLFNKFGGMVPLLDLFYFYNKKRQTCLIAPEELLKACAEMEKIGLGARLVTYKGNIKMLESTTFDGNTDFQKNFSQFLSFEQGVTADDISKRKGLPLIVVQIKLDNALKRGRVVKDDRIQGLKYYNNLILAMK